MKVAIKEGCIACGLCISICPDVFTMNDTGVASAIETPEEGFKDEVEQAADSCPVSVILVE